MSAEHLILKQHPVVSANLYENCDYVVLGLVSLWQGGGEHKDTAMKITNSLINIRAITAHFQPRIEAWLAAQQLSTPSEV